MFHHFSFGSLHVARAHIFRLGYPSYFVRRKEAPETVLPPTIARLHATIATVFSGHTDRLRYEWITGGDFACAGVVFWLGTKMLGYKTQGNAKSPYPLALCPSVSPGRWLSP